MASPFTVDEVKDFQALGEKLKQEHPNDPSIWPVLGLIALLVGIYLFSKDQNNV